MVWRFWTRVASGTLDSMQPQARESAEPVKASACMVIAVRLKDRERTGRQCREPLVTSMSSSVAVREKQ